IADELAYTTVLTVLRTLEQKGYVGHTEDGRAHRYKPLVKREVAGRTALRRLVEKVFDGSPELLLTQLVSDKNLSDEELRRWRNPSPPDRSRSSNRMARFRRRRGRSPSAISTPRSRGRGASPPGPWRSPCSAPASAWRHGAAAGASRPWTVGPCSCRKTSARR